MDENDEYNLEINPDELCVACLSQEQKLMNLFTSEIVDGRIMALPKIYETVTEIKMIKGSELPSKICIICKSKMIDLFLFREKCQKSKELLNTIFKYDPSGTSTYNKTPAVAKCEPTEIKIIQIEATTTTTNPQEPNLPNVQQSLEQQNNEMTFETAAAMIYHESPVEKMETENVVFEDDDVENPEYLEDEFLSQNQDSSDDAPNDETFKDDDGGDEIVSGEVSCLDSIVTWIEIKEKLFSCDLCNKKYKTNAAFTNHKKTHEKINLTADIQLCNRYTCYFCHIMLKQDTADTIQHHIELHDIAFKFILDTISMLRCNCCSMVFADRNAYLDHVNLETECSVNVKEFYLEENRCQEFQYIEKSSLCTTRFVHKSNKILSPRLIHLETGELRWQCVDCVDDFVVQDLDDFMEHQHEDDELVRRDDESYRCCMCSKWSTNPIEIMLHTYLHSNEFHCPIGDCCNVYNNLGDLHRHLEKTNFHMVLNKCKTCTIYFNNNSELMTHLKDECPNRNMCDVCDKSFGSLNNLKAHKRIHTGKRKHECDVCRKRFNQVSDLKIHKRTHTDERPYKCKICEKTFRTYGNRSDHMSTHSEEHRFTCLVCGKAFKAARILKSHQELHLSDRKFECNVCQKMFRRNTHLKSHLKVHERLTAHTDTVDMTQVSTVDMTQVSTVDMTQVSTVKSKKKTVVSST